MRAAVNQALSRAVPAIVSMAWLVTVTVAMAASAQYRLAGDFSAARRRR